MHISSELILESLPEPDNVIDSSVALIVENVRIVEKKRVRYKYCDTAAMVDRNHFDMYIRTAVSKKNVERAVSYNYNKTSKWKNVMLLGR